MEPTQISVGGMRRRRFLQLAAAGGMAAGAGAFLEACGGGSASGGSQTVRLGDTVAADNPEVASEQFFGKRLSDLTNGAYAVKVFPNGVLGEHSSMNDQLRAGSLQMAKSNVADLTKYDRRLEIFSLPYSFPDKQSLFAAEDGKLGQTYDNIVQNYGLKIIGWFDSGSRNVYNTMRPIHEPADLRGLKIRIQQDQIMIDTFNLLGAQATPIPTTQIYSALQQGVVDAAENSIVFYVQEHHNEVAKYFSWTKHFFSIDPLLVSLRWFNGLPTKARDAIVQAGKETEQHERDAWKSAEDTYIKNAQSAGTKLNDADIPSFQAAVKPIYDKYRGQFGDLMNELQYSP